MQKIEKDWKRILLWSVLLLFLTACGNKQETRDSAVEKYEEGSAAVREVELFLYSPCESCREEETFQSQVLQSLGEQQNKVSIRVYNVFQTSGMNKLEKRMEELEEEMDLSVLPVAIVEDEMLSGTYGEIAEQIAAVFSGEKQNWPEEEGRKQKEEVKKQEKSIADGLDQVKKSGKTVPVFVLFTTFCCDSCRTVEDFLCDLKNSSDGYISGSREFELVSGSILETENLELLNGLFEHFQIPSEEQKVPILFWENGYLSGEKMICQEFEGCLSDMEEGKGAEFFLEMSEEKIPKKADRMLWAGAMATGFLNGLNPCGASMLLMVLSVLMMRQKGFLKASMTYLAGKFMAYVLMGAGAFSLFSAVDLQGGGIVRKGIRLIFVVFALVLSILNFRDYFFAGKGEYGRIKVQLPRKLREWNHHKIGGLKEVPERFLIPAVFALGVIISAGEFFCTGQIYLASILYLIKENSAGGIRNYLYLAVYTAALCVPQLLLILIIQRARSMAGASKLTLKGMPVVKLIYGILFLIFAGMLLLL